MRNAGQGKRCVAGLAGKADSEWLLHFDTGRHAAAVRDATLHRCDRLQQFWIDCHLPARTGRGQRDVAAV